MKCSKGKRNCLLVFFSVTALMFLVVGIIFDIIVNKLIDLELKQKLPLVNGTTAYKNWVDPPVPIKFKIYVFDVVNPEEVMDGSEVPSVVERGPYVYRLHLHKTNITQHPHNSTVSYVQIQTFVFDRENSVGPETDTFTTVNIPILTADNMIQYEPDYFKTLFNLFARGNKEVLFSSRTVHDIFWGYHDPVLEFAKDFFGILNITSPILNGKFGFYMDRNHSGDGLYNVFSGANYDFSKYAAVDTWNKENQLSQWKSKYANELRGATDGSMFPPRVTKDSKLSMFDSYYQRSVDMKYSGESSYAGIDTLRFKLPFDAFYNFTGNPENSGFCTPNVKFCIPSGAYNITVGSNYAPMFMSLPHFVGADPYYRERVTGLNPDPEKHQPFFDIQPLTGVVMQAARRYQVNVRIRSYGDLSIFENVQESYLPIIWIEGGALIDEGSAKIFRDQIQKLLDILPKIRITILVLSSFTLLVVLCILTKRWVKWSKNNNLSSLEQGEASINQPLLL